MRREELWAECGKGEVRRIKKFEERRIMWRNEVDRNKEVNEVIWIRYRDK